MTTAPSLNAGLRSFAALVATMVLTALASMPAQANAATPTAPAPDLAKGQAIATQVCAACHAADGSRGSPAYPILAGQHREYLSKELQDLKSGKRVSPVMQGFASTLSEDDIRNVAAFYASKSAKPGFAKHKDQVKLAEKIYRAGIPDRGVPACSGCHSPNGAGIPAQYPRIGGQHADYTEAQLRGFRSGTRTNSVQMLSITERMTDREIAAVADYLAGLR